MKSLEIPKNNYLGGNAMGKYEFKIKRFRKKLEKSGFFEDVILDKSEFVLKELDGGISGWFYY